MSKEWSLKALPLCLTIVAAAPAWGQAEAVDSSIKIVAPSPDGIVQRVNEVVIETKTAGFPIVLVRPLDETVEWWVQPASPASKAGRYKMKCYFGNAATPNGKAFQIVALLAPTEQRVKELTKQQVFSELPAKVPYSEPRRVVRTNPANTSQTPSTVTASTATSGTAAAKLFGLANHMAVSRRQEIRGHTKGDLPPVLLVRSTEPNSLWWVQSPIKPDEGGRFTTVIRFGNDRTADGSEFEVLALTPSSSEAAKKFEPGTSFRELPDQVKEPATVVVVLKAALAREVE